MPVPISMCPPCLLPLILLYAVRMMYICLQSGLFKSLVQLYSVEEAINAKLMLDGSLFHSHVNPSVLYGKVRVAFSTMADLLVNPMAVQCNKARDYTLGADGQGMNYQVS